MDKAALKTALIKSGLVLIGLIVMGSLIRRCNGSWSPCSIGQVSVVTTLTKIAPTKNPSSRMKSASH